MNWFISEFNLRASRFVKRFSLIEAPDVTLIYGPRGVGKSALLDYLYNKMEPESGCINIDALAFARQYAYSAQENNLNLFRKRYRSAQLLILDDLQGLAGKAKTIEELHYTYEYIIANGGKLVITVEADILALDFLGERLASRFLSGVVIPIERPQQNEIERFLEDYIRELRIFMGEAVLIKIAEQATNFADAKISVQKFIQFAEFQQDELGLTCFRNYREYEESKKRKAADPMNIVRVVGETMEITMEELLGSSRKLNVNEAREMAIYSIRSICQISYPEIGRFFNRNHNTVMMSYKKMKNKLVTDRELLLKYESILSAFEIASR